MQLPKREDLEELPFDECEQHGQAVGSNACSQPAAVQGPRAPQQQQQQQQLPCQQQHKEKLLTPNLALRLAQKGSKAPLTTKDLRQLLTLRANGLGITGVQDMLCLARLETL